MPLPRPERTVTAHEVRAMAHPIRIRLLEELRNGPATATMLARELGESSGATSYHLRELAKAGLVEDEPERGNGRDRWWKRTTGMLLVSSDPADDAEYEAALGQLRSVLVRRDEEALARYFANVADAPHEWQDASFLGGWNVFVTAEELQELSAVVLEQLERLRRPASERPPDARQVYLTYRALVQPRAEPPRADSATD
jgi:DNA-binding transcriptional ArsR family regulator